MQVVPARINPHFARISELARRHYFTENDPLRTNGFFRYLPSEGKIVDLMDDSHLCFVVPKEKGIAGYVLAADQRRLAKLSAKGRLHWSVQFLFENNPGNLIYIDQLAVSNPRTIEGARAAKLLIDKVLAIGKKNSSLVACYIASAPWENIDCKKFAEGVGFVRRGGFYGGEVELGLYKISP